MLIETTSRITQALSLSRLNTSLVTRACVEINFKIKIRSPLSTTPGPYLTVVDFLNATAGCFSFKKEGVLKAAWEQYLITTSSSAEDPAILYSSNDLPKLHSLINIIKEPGKVYMPRRHSLEVNASWVLANCHIGKSFVSLSHLIGANIGHHTDRGFRYSALTNEINWIRRAGYKLAKFDYSIVSAHQTECFHYVPEVSREALTQLSLQDLIHTKNDCAETVEEFSRNLTKLILIKSQFQQLQLYLSQIHLVKSAIELQQLKINLITLIEKIFTGINRLEINYFVDNFNHFLGRSLEVYLMPEQPQLKFFPDLDVKIRANNIKDLLSVALNKKIDGLALALSRQGPILS